MSSDYRKLYILRIVTLTVPGKGDHYISGELGWERGKWRLVGTLDNANLGPAHFPFTTAQSPPGNTARKWLLAAAVRRLNCRRSEIDYDRFDWIGV